jgi:hypothetical protein
MGFIIGAHDARSELEKLEELPSSVNDLAIATTSLEGFAETVRDDVAWLGDAGDAEIDALADDVREKADAVVSQAGETREAISDLEEAFQTLSSALDAEEAEEEPARRPPVGPVRGSRSWGRRSRDRDDNRTARGVGAEVSRPPEAAGRSQAIRSRWAGDIAVASISGGGIGELPLKAVGRHYPRDYVSVSEEVLFDEEYVRALIEGAKELLSEVETKL